MRRVRDLVQYNTKINDTYVEGVSITENGYCTALLPGEHIVEYMVNVQDGNNANIRMIPAKVCVSLDTPTINSMSYDEEGCVKINFSPVNGADGYRVVHSYSDGKIITTEKGECYLEGNNTLAVPHIRFEDVNQYKIYAYKNVSGQEYTSEKSNECTIEIGKRPSLKNMIAVRSDSGETTVTWDKNKWAESYVLIRFCHIVSETGGCNPVLGYPENIKGVEYREVLEPNMVHVVYCAYPYRSTWFGCDEKGGDGQIIIAMGSYSNFWKDYDCWAEYESGMIPCFFAYDGKVIKKYYEKGSKIERYIPEDLSGDKYFKGWDAFLSHLTPDSGGVSFASEQREGGDLQWDFDKDTIDKEMVFQIITSGYPIPDSEYVFVNKKADATKKYISNPEHICNTTDGLDKDYSNFSYIYFGAYPQSEVKDATITSEIDTALLKKGMTVGDVWVDGIKYRKIGINQISNPQQFENNQYKYFKWDRIKWKVLKISGNKAVLLADYAIDTKRYNEELV